MAREGLRYKTLRKRSCNVTKVLINERRAAVADAFVIHSERKPPRGGSVPDRRLAGPRRRPAEVSAGIRRLKRRRITIASRVKEEGMKVPRGEKKRKRRKQDRVECAKRGEAPLPAHNANAMRSTERGARRCRARRAADSPRVRLQCRIYVSRRGCEEVAPPRDPASPRCMITAAAAAAEAAAHLPRARTSQAQ